MPTWLLLTPLVRPIEPPVPIRLNSLVESTPPVMSSGIAGAPMPVPLKLPATIVLRRKTAPDSL